MQTLLNVKSPHNSNANNPKIVKPALDAIFMISDVFGRELDCHITNIDTTSSTIASKQKYTP